MTSPKKRLNSSRGNSHCVEIMAGCASAMVYNLTWFITSFEKIKWNEEAGIAITLWVEYVVGPLLIRTMMCATT